MMVGSEPMRQIVGISVEVIVKEKMVMHLIMRSSSETVVVVGVAAIIDIATLEFDIVDVEVAEEAGVAVVEVPG